MTDKSVLNENKKEFAKAIKRIEALKFWTIEDGRIRPLADLEESVFWLFLEEMEKQYSNEKIKVVFRGKSKKSFCETLSNDNTTKGKSLIYNIMSRFFMVGEKSKHCEHKNIKVKDDNYEDETFEIIFNNLRDVLKENDGAVCFLQENKDFSWFFDEKENSKGFIKLLPKDREERKLIRDYYLILLHQLSNNELKKESLYVSTTQDIEVALNFAVKDGVLIFCWQPFNKKVAINKNTKDILTNCGLPVYKKEPFPEEKETSIWACVFPHNIIGVEFIKEKKFFVNPYFFNNIKININEILKKGFKIDQSMFDEYLRETKYLKSYTEYDNGKGKFSDL